MSTHIHIKDICILYNFKAQQIYHFIDSLIKHWYHFNFDILQKKRPQSKLFRIIMPYLDNLQNAHICSFIHFYFKPISLISRDEENDRLPVVWELLVQINDPDLRQLRVQCIFFNFDVILKQEADIRNIRTPKAGERTRTRLHQAVHSLLSIHKQQPRYKCTLHCPNPLSYCRNNLRKACVYTGAVDSKCSEHTWKLKGRL